MICAQGAHFKYYRPHRLDWDTNSMPISKEQDPNTCEKKIRSLDGTDRSEVNQYSYEGSFTSFR